MRVQWLGACVMLAVAACSARPQTGPEAVSSSGAGGTIGEFVLKGQVVVAHPPGERDAVDEVRRQAALRCPAGFLIRTLRTQDSSAADLQYRLRTYEAVVDCNPPAPAPGARY